MKILLNITESKPCSIHKGWPSTENQNHASDHQVEFSKEIFTTTQRLCFLYEWKDMQRAERKKMIVDWP